MNFVNDHRIPLEVCINSNIQTQAVEDVANHPFKFYYDFGVRVTLNTDNRLVTNTTVTKEYMTAIDAFKLTAGDVRQLVVNGFKSAFLPFHERQATLRKICLELDDLLQAESALQDDWSEDEMAEQGQALDLPDASEKKTKKAPVVEA